MPELAEVEYFKRRWEAAVGSRIVEVRALHGHRVFRGSDTHHLAATLTGRRLQSAEARGKQMLFRFGEDGWLGIHLGMAGKLFREESSEYTRHKHDPLVLATSREVLVFRDTRTFGRIRWQASLELPHWWTSIGPDLLSKDFKRADLETVLRKHAGSPLKPILLDQRYFPGIGNWMADEILWRSAIHPESRAGDLDQSQVKALYRRIRAVCRDALKVIAPDWSRPPDTWLFNHRWKDGGSCPKTGEPLRRIQVGGRTTCFSPARQRKQSQSKSEFPAEKS